jgi:radical SAM protein with 4Fe4S-binding SPASM domain
LNSSYFSSVALPEFSIWEKIRAKRALFSFDLEVTARCNNYCRHCYINIPAGDVVTEENELPTEKIKEIVDEAVILGALWCLITGGEPLLRKDFFDIYLHLKRKGLLVSIFTNATLVTEEHVKLFQKYPPRNIEVSVYGVTKDTYECVTRIPGSFAAFMTGLDSLLESGAKVVLKAMALRSNVAELPAIESFCRERNMDHFRFDPFLHLRFDQDSARNENIRSERLSPTEIVKVEQSDSRRFESLGKACEKLIASEFSHFNSNHLFHCGAGNCSFTVGYDGLFRLCSSLWHPECVYDLKRGSLTDAWYNFVPMVREMRSDRKEFKENCWSCPLINLCMWCPAHAYLETGEMDAPVDYFCKAAHARAEALQGNKRSVG